MFLMDMCGLTVLSLSDKESESDFVNEFCVLTVLSLSDSES